MVTQQIFNNISQAPCKTKSESVYSRTVETEVHTPTRKEKLGQTGRF